MLQFNAKTGDSIKVGALTFVIEGALDKVPGQTGITSTIAPVVYIPLAYLEETGLTKIGSRIQYKYYYKFNKPSAVESLVKRIQPQLDKEGLDAETVESTKEDTGRSFRDVNRFLALAGFVALLLGCIGVGSAIHVYIGEKLGTIATLRCLGVKAREAFLHIPDPALFHWIDRCCCRGYIGYVYTIPAASGIKRLFTGRNYHEGILVCHSAGHCFGRYHFYSFRITIAALRPPHFSFKCFKTVF